MIDCAVAAGSAMLLRVNVPAPLVSTTSPGTVVVLTRTGPATPCAPVWMCAMLTTAVDGKFVMLTWKFTTAFVIVLLASRVTTKSIVAVPLPDASAFVIGGVSCAGDSAAVNRTLDVPAPVEEGDVVLELEPEQPAARSKPTTAIARRFMCCDTPLLNVTRRTCV